MNLFLVCLKTDLKSAKCYLYPARSLLFAVRTRVGHEAKLEGDRMPIPPGASEVLVNGSEMGRILREETQKLKKEDGWA